MKHIILYGSREDITKYEGILRETLKVTERMNVSLNSIIEKSKYANELFGIRFDFENEIVRWDSKTFYDKIVLIDYPNYLYCSIEDYLGFPREKVVYLSIVEKTILLKKECPNEHQFCTPLSVQETCSLASLKLHRFLF